MSNPEWGIKRACPSCGIKYYDFKKNPIICPKCEFEFDPDLLLKSRKGRSIVSKTEEVEVSKVSNQEEETLEEDINSIQNDDEILEIDNVSEIENDEIDNKIEENVNNDDNNLEIIDDDLDEKDKFSVVISDDEEEEDEK
tara:strand:- start:40 stop:459 length:420 start_codon:yes stop_codon:yes gene_type:complete